MHGSHCVHLYNVHTSLCIITSPCTSACTPLSTVVCTRTMQYAVRCSGLEAPPSCSVTPLLQKVNTQNSTPIGLLVNYSLQNTLSNKYCEADAGSLAIGTLSSAKCSSMHSLQMPSSAAFISKSKIQIFKSDFSCISAVLQN